MGATAVASSARVPSAADRNRICVGAIAGSHGIKGAVRIKSFTDVPEDVAAYGPISDEAGDRRFDIGVEAVRGGMVIAALGGVADRDAAEALKVFGSTFQRTHCRNQMRTNFITRTFSGLRSCRMGE